MGSFGRASAREPRQPAPRGSCFSGIPEHSSYPVSYGIIPLSLGDTSGWPILKGKASRNDNKSGDTARIEWIPLLWQFIHAL